MARLIPRPNPLSASKALVSGSGTVSAPGPIKLVTRGQPITASSGTAANATDSDYSSVWTASGLPATITLNVSAFRSSIVPDGSGFTPFMLSINDIFTGYLSGAGNFSDYTIQVSTASAGGAPPTSGTTVVTVTGNIYAAKAHLIDLTGINWVIISITSSSASFQFDGFDCSNSGNVAHTAVKAGHLLIGDSIDAFSLALDPQGLPGSPLSIGDQVKAILGGPYTPPTQMAGIPGWGINSAFSWLAAQGSSTYFENAVAQTPFGNIDLLLGTNNATENVGYSLTYSGLVAMKDICVTYDKRLIIHNVPWGFATNLVNGRAGVDQALIDICTNFPGRVIAGADRHTYYFNNQVFVGPDGVHFTGDGNAAHRELISSVIAIYGAGA